MLNIFSSNFFLNFDILSIYIGFFILTILYYLIGSINLIRKNSYNELKNYYEDNFKDQFCLLISVGAFVVSLLELDFFYVKIVKFHLYLYAIIDGLFTTKDLIFHHMLIISTCSFYDIFFPKESENIQIRNFEKSATYLMFNTEFSSIFLCFISLLKKNNLNNSIYMQICMYTFFLLFIKTRIVDFFLKFWNHPNQIEVISTVCSKYSYCQPWYYFSIISLMSLNIYWFQLLLKKLSRQLISLATSEKIILNMKYAKTIAYSIGLFFISSNSMYLPIYIVFFLADTYPEINKLIEIFRPSLFYLTLLDSIPLFSTDYLPFISFYINQTMINVLYLNGFAFFLIKVFNLSQSKVIAITFLLIYSSVFIVPIHQIHYSFWMTYYYFGIFYLLYFYMKPIQLRENSTLFLNLLCWCHIIYLQNFQKLSPI